MPGRPGVVEHRGLPGEQITVDRRALPGRDGSDARDGDSVADHLRSFDRPGEAFAGLAAAEVAIGLSIIIAVYRNYRSIRTREITDLGS